MFKKSRIFLAALALPWLLVMFVGTWRIDYQITTPGNLTNVSNYIALTEENPQENPIYSVYIMSFRNPTFLQFMISTLNDYHDVRQLTPTQISQGVSDRDQFESGQVDRNTSIDASFITSLEALGLPISYDVEYIVRLYYHYIDIKDDQPLNIRDLVLSVNGNDDVLSAVNQAACGEYHLFEIERENGDIDFIEIKRQERNNQCTFGLSVSEYYRITDAAVELIAYDSLVGGPSGGLMQTLYIYNALSDVDLTKNLRIAGTGGILIDGRASSVGGIREKIITAEKTGIDVFYVPKNDNITNDNYTIAMETKEAINGEIDIVGVYRFEDIINDLLIRQGGGASD